MLRATSPSDAPELNAILATPEVSAWWHEADSGWLLQNDAHTSRLTIIVGGEVAGMIQFTEEKDPDYRHAGIDIFLAPRHHRRGLGTDVLITMIGYLVEQRGHHRFTIDPAADNVAAIRCYEKAGFRRVGVMRSHWRDHATGRWRDGLLMELVIEAGPTG